ncbi:glycoside hydrolase family 13 protein [Chryseobacterium koreense]|uniref:glycoside hydrolase family 13 protein n=1 Tax=Chryseobacterium koreense TaxID=232216 RepID=UPI0026E9522F|nr:glycoside hydrolase family 13 protein [Chryseobacterium koreense]
MKNLILTFALFVSVSLFSQIQKVEPSFWWKGMKNPELQILIYGKNIAHQQIELSNGVQIKDIKKVENPNYVFITINTDEINVSKFKINLKDGKKLVNSYEYELKVRNPNSANRESYTSKDVMYLIMPDRFANGNPANDSSKNLIEKSDRSNPNGRHGGDLRGIINNLDYIEDLGATAVWLTPVCEDNEPRTTYHGYAQTDLYKIDERYGTNEEYRELSQKLNQRGMKLVMDYVTNHWGASHWMIRDLPEKSWIHWFDQGENGFMRSNYKTTSQMDPNASAIDRKLALDGWFDSSMPDMNQKNPLVLKYLTQNAIWWIEYAELGGFRVDTYPYNDKEAMAKWAKSITDEYPNFNIVGETWMYSAADISFWQKNSKVGEILNYNSNLPSVMDFTLFSEMPKAFSETDSWDKGLIRLYNVFTQDYLYPDLKNMLVFFENHDTERWNEIFNSDPKTYQLALTLIATTRGIPQIYYGTEIGMRGSKPKGGDADIRRDFPGGWNGDSQNAFVSRTDEQKPFYDFTSKLLKWRKGKDVIHNGKMMHFIPENNVYVYFRYHNSEKVMVVLNSNEKDQILDLNRFSEMLQGVSTGKDVITNKEFSINPQNKLTVGAKSSLILELR